MRKAFENALVIGLGGGGGKIVQTIAQMQPGSWLRLVAMDTDVTDLSFVDGVHQIPMGEKWCKGRSSGGDDAKAAYATAELVGDLRSMIDEVAMVIVIGCLGGGTASGAMPIVNRVLKEERVRSFCFATVPAEFEGTERRNRAKFAIEEMMAHDDLIFRYENDLLFSIYGDETTLSNAMQEINDSLANAILGLAGVIKSREGIPLDLESLNLALSKKPAATTFAGAYAEGEGAVHAVVEQISKSPTLGGDEFTRSVDFVIAAISGGSGMTLGELRICLHDLRSIIGNTPRTICSASILEEQPEKSLRLTMVAIKFKRSKDKMEYAESKKLKQGDNTIVMSGGDNLPVPINDVSGMLGTFGNVSPTIVDGENLDVPTFMRKGIGIQQIMEEISANANED